MDPITDELKNGVADLGGLLQAALKSAQQKDAEIDRLTGENRVLLEKVASAEALVKAAGAKPAMTDGLIDAVLSDLGRADILQPGAGVKIASVLRADPIGGLMSTISKLSDMLAPAIPPGQPIEKQAAQEEGSPWSRTLQHGA